MSFSLIIIGIYLLHYLPIVTHTYTLYIFKYNLLGTFSVAPIYICSGLVTWYWIINYITPPWEKQIFLPQQSSVACSSSSRLGPCERVPPFILASPLVLLLFRSSLGSYNVESSAVSFLLISRRQPQMLYRMCTASVMCLKDFILTAAPNGKFRRDPLYLYLSL